MCEEVKRPSIQVPRAMVGTLFLNTIAGLVFLIPLVFVMPDIAPLIASGQPVPLIFKSAVGSNGGAIGLLIPLMVLAILCGIGCTTATSRCAWAFARDGAIPGAKLWMKVNHSLDVPLNAMLLCMVVEILLGLIYFGSSAAFLAFSGVGVMCLTAAYATPIAISLFTGRKQVRQGMFYLGPLGLFCNVIALGMSRTRPISYHFRTLICSPSLVCPGPATLLYALVRRCHCRDCQLCSSRIRWRHAHLWYLVLGLGIPQLCRPPHPRGVERL
jgi:amino acid transporter